MKLSMILTVAMVGGFAFAMPTRKELKDASPIVRNRLAEEQRAVAEGRKTRTEVADAAVKMVASASSEAEKMLLLKGAVIFYAKDGNYRKAAETLTVLRNSIDRIPDEAVDSLARIAENIVKPEDRARFHDMMTAGKKSASGDGAASAAKQTGGMKLPSALMPQEGRTADFDFEGDEPASRVKSDVEISGVHMSMGNGCLAFDGVYRNEWEKDVVFYGLNLDGFTLAMSFCPRNVRKWRGEMINSTGGLLRVDCDSWRSNTICFSLANSGTIELEAAVVENEWNYFVISVDSLKKVVSFVINGKYYAPRTLPPGFSWPFAPGDSEREMKSIMFGNASCGCRFEGEIDELMVYDHPLAAAELKKIVGLQQVTPVKVDKRIAAKKLPQASMPQDGRVADFDFDADELEDKSGGAATVSGENKEVTGGRLVFDGKYDGVSKGEIYVPGINFDHFTVSMSFMLKAWPRGFGQVFVLGRNNGNALVMRVGRKELEFQFANSDEIKIEAPLKLGEWNWFVLSVDTVNKKVRYVFNGQKGMPRSLSEGFSWSETRVGNREARGFQFRDPSFGTRFNGEVDDFIVYDRALSAEELTRIAKRQPAPKVVQKKSVKDRERTQAGAKKDSAKSPVKLDPDAWVLKMGTVRSAFWNATISRDGKVLAVHCAGDELCVQPLAFAGTDLDLSKPVMSEDGATFKIIGIGALRGGAGGIGGGHMGSLSRIKLPETLTALHAGAFAGSHLEEIVLPKGLKHIGDAAFDGCVDLKRIVLPEGLLSIGGHAFFRCTALDSIEIPKSVEHIGGLAFMNCGALLTVRVKGPTRLGERVFAGSTPAGCKLPAGKKAGPFALEAKKDATLAYALNGRMKEPFINDLKFGEIYNFISGYGHARFERCPEIADYMDLSYHKVGPELICGSSVSWEISEELAGTAARAQRSLDLAFKMVSKTFPKIKLNPVRWKTADDWPSSVKGLDTNYGQQEILYRAIEANDFSECVAESRTEADGYRIDFRVWGSRESKIVFLSFDIVDMFMQRAWGVER